MYCIKNRHIDVNAAHRWVEMKLCTVGGCSPLILHMQMHTYINSGSLLNSQHNLQNALLSCLLLWLATIMFMCQTTLGLNLNYFWQLCLNFKCIFDYYSTVNNINWSTKLNLRWNHVLVLTICKTLRVYCIIENSWNSFKSSKWKWKKE